MVCDLIGMDGVKTLVMYNLPVETRCYLPCVFSSSFALTCWSSSTLLSCCNLATFKLAFCCIQGSYPLSETNFQDFSRTQIDFSRLQNSHWPLHYKISMLILLTVFHTLSIFLVEFNWFPELSSTSAIFPGLSSPGKCHNKIPGLSRFSRTRTNPVHICMWY